MFLDEKILVTGAGGFIGGWIAETLFLINPKCVRAGVHSWVGAVRPARFPMEIVPCDIINMQQITDALSGISCVIHCAKGPLEESIIQGTKNMLFAALQQGVKRFIYISTTEIYGNTDGIVDEATPFQLTGNSYGDSKIKAEELCWEYCAKGLQVVVIRPPIVYGPFSKTWTVNIAQKLQSGNWGIFKRQGEGFCNLIYISDLVGGILLAVQNEHAIGEAFNLNGPDKLTWNEYFEAYNNALGLPELKVYESSDVKYHAKVMEPLRISAKYIKDHFKVPVKQVAVNFPLARSMMKFIEVKMRTSPRLSDFNLFSRRALYISNKAQELLDYNPRINLEAGLEMIIPWLIQIGLVDPISI